MSETKHDPTPGALSGPNLPRRLRILCADDQPDVRACLSKCLLQAGYEAILVADGELAWQALQSAPYDLLVTDQQMPRLTGAELILRMRLNGLSVPVVVISSDLEVFSASRCESLHISALLPKPFSVGEFVRTVAQVLKAEPNEASGPPPPSGPLRNRA